jgi:hypothetical protein
MPVEQRSAVRQWKRDGSLHRMSLKTAVDVARGNPVKEVKPAPTVADVTAMLLAGYRLETPQSWIYLE